MKIFKKLLPLILVITLILAFSVGCGFVINGGTTETAQDCRSADPTNSTYNVSTTVNLNFRDEQDVQLKNTPLVDVLEEIRPSVVEVYAENEGSVSAGSGVVFGKSENNNELGTYYEIITCHHVIEGSTVIAVKDIYGTQFSAALVGGDAESDIAVIRVYENKNANKEFKFSVAQMRQQVIGQSYVKVGEGVVAIGNPLGTLGGTVTRGIISSVDREVTVVGRKMTLIQTDCAINSGNSGGALFSEYGALIGIVNAGYAGEVEGLNFAIPMTVAGDIYNKLVSTWKNDTELGYIEGRAEQIAIGYMKGNNYIPDSTLAQYDIVIYDRFNQVFVYYVNEKGLLNGLLKTNDIIKSVKFKEDEAKSNAQTIATFIQNISAQANDELIFTINEGEQKTYKFVQYKYNPYN